MSDQAIEFLQDWIDDKIPPAAPVAIAEKAGSLVRQCEADAAEAGVPLEEIAEEVGSLEDLIAAKLEDAIEAMQSQ
jgi:hypothetical protein